MDEPATSVIDSKTPSAPASRRGCLARAARAGMWLVTGLLALMVIGASNQVIATEVDRRSFQPRGQLLMINGHAMHLVCKGEGSPAVILLAGGAADSLWWQHVQDDLSAHTRVCAYDRPGHGWSEPTSDSRDANSIVAELRSLLQQAGVPPPYIMAGHSFGALWARIYAAQHPDEVEGVALVDSTFLIPTRFDNPQAFAQWKQSNDALKVVEWAAFRLGLVRLTAPGGFLQSGYAHEVARELAALRSPNHVFDADYAEQVGTRLEFTEAAAGAENLGDMPLMVLWAGQSPTAQGYFKPLREAMTRYSTDSVTRFIAGADHGSILGQPQYAQQVSDALRDLLDAVRLNKPLTTP